jgi:hypothetical protein
MRYLARQFEADRVVILDLAPVPDRNKNCFINRNCISDQEGAVRSWLTVPIHRAGRSAISEVRIDKTDHRWVRRHIGRINELYPSNTTLAPGFLAGLESLLHDSSGSLLDLNLITTQYILSELRTPHWAPVLQSTITFRHSKEHRIEIARMQGATRYIAGQVEWELMRESGELEAFAHAGIQVVRSPELDSRAFEGRLVVSNSAISAICSHGRQFASDLLDRAVQFLTQPSID